MRKVPQRLGGRLCKYMQIEKKKLGQILIKYKEDPPAI
jgi:hypothetical protein